jgi:hypothetical protein
MSASTYHSITCRTERGIWEEVGEVNMSNDETILNWLNSI